MTVVVRINSMTQIDPDIPLPEDLETAHRLIRELLATLREKTHLSEKLQHQLNQLLRQIYGRKSEKLDPGQLLLFAREIAEAWNLARKIDPPSARKIDPPGSSK